MLEKFSDNVPTTPHSRPSCGGTAMKWLGGLFKFLGILVVVALVLWLAFLKIPRFQDFVYRVFEYDLNTQVKRAPHYDEWTSDRPPKLIRTTATNEFHIHGALASLSITASTSTPAVIRPVLAQPVFELESIEIVVRNTERRSVYRYRPRGLVAGVPPSDGSGLVVRVGPDASTNRCYWYKYREVGSAPFVGEMPAFQRVDRNRFSGNCLPNGPKAYLKSAHYPLQLDDSAEIPIAIFIDQKFPGTYEIDLSLGYALLVGGRRMHRSWPQSGPDKASAHFTIAYEPESEVPPNPNPLAYSNEEWRRRWLAADEERRRKGGEDPPRCLDSPGCFNVTRPTGPPIIPSSLPPGGWPGSHFLRPDLPSPQLTPLLAPRKPFRPEIPGPEPPYEPSPEPFPGPEPWRGPVPIFPTPYPLPPPIRIP